jgi:hypothetical protein
MMILVEKEGNWLHSELKDRLLNKQAGWLVIGQPLLSMCLSFFVSL